MGGPPDDRGGGAESFARRRQNDYHLNANLVLTANREGRPRGKEPTGEPETLAGRSIPKMGDRAAHTVPEELKKRQARENVAQAPSKRPRVETVLEADKYGVYQPKSRETREAYAQLLQMVQTRLGDHPPEVLYGAAEEVLAVLKDDEKRAERVGVQAQDKEHEVKELLDCDVQDLKDHFHEFIDLGIRITDWEVEGEGGEAGANDDMGVAVDFDDDDENDAQNEMVPTIVPSDDEDADGEDTEMVTNLNTDMDLGDAEDTALALNVTEIGAYWLQRAINEAYTKDGESLDATATQAKDKEVLRLLASNSETAQLETDLVFHLDFKRFELIKLLVANRKKIAWCTKLMRAKSDEEKVAIETDMYNDPSLTGILAQLKSTRASARDRKNAMINEVREEARKLRENDGAAAAAKGPEVWDSEVAARQVLDLESLQFQGGGHYMAENAKVSVPKESYRKLEKGYEEVCVPAPKKRGLVAGEKLVAISDLPGWAQPAFEGMTSLNAVQSKVYQTALHTAHNILLCAPTGAGKTNVAVLSVLQVIGGAIKEDGNIDKDAFKIVYIAPMKALVAEIVGNFQKRLDEQYGIQTRELTGDVSLSKAEIEETQIIVTTPEKWDVITRKGGERAYTQLVKLVIIDEVHLLHDDRGPVLECLIARTLRQVESTAEMVRLVGLSATLPNYEDVAALLRVKKDYGLFKFSAAYRPCPLAQTFIGVTIKKPLQRFQLMNEICYKKIMDAAGKHQVMIFVHSRKETAKTARFLRDKALADEQLTKLMRPDSGSRELLQVESDNTQDNVLKDILPYSFGVHHAGMRRVDRTTVEELFAAGHIQVLVSTATLAWGVNLPAHTVIIKGTQIYNPVKGAWVELSPQDVMQMLGRAGRPQYDSFGEGIIITQHSELTYYLSLLNEQLPIESQFVSRLADSLNAEIVLGTLQNLKDAATWLGYTYLNIRMMKSPQQYGIPFTEAEQDPKMLRRRKDLVHTAALELDTNNLIRYDRKTGVFQATDLGRIAAQYYITHNTLREYNQHLKPTMGEIELLRVFCLADEFKYFVVRDEEKLELARLSQRVPIPIKDSVEEPTAKTNVLLQAYISGLKLDGLALMADLVYIAQSANRLMRALFEICLRRNWAPLAEAALLLCKAVQHRMWPSQTPLRQFKGKLKLPAQTLTTLEKKDIPWERYFDMRPAQLGELINAPSLGKIVKKMINQIPRLQLEASIQPLTRGLLRMDLILTPDFQWDQEQHGYVEPFLILVEDQDSEFILHKEYFYLKMSNATGDRIVEHPVSFTVPIPEPLPPQFFIRVVSDRWLGSEAIAPVSFKNVVLPQRFHPPTELLDLQPLPVTALRNKRFEAMYSNITHFNPIQTQVFSALFGGKDNVLVCAPAGSGKEVCAEFALLSLINEIEAKAKEVEAKNKEAEDGSEVKVPQVRAVYVASMTAIVEQVKASWETRFGSDGLGLNVVQLTGEQQVDLKLLQKGNLIVATAEHWDRVSRRWRRQKAISDISLFIVDELHLLGSEGGPALEVVVSRMRAISKLLEKPIRVVGLGASMADGKEVGEWLGVPSHAQFTFPPSVRPVPLEIHIQSMDIPSFEARMQAMSRPTYNAVLQYAKAKPAIVFAPTRRHAQSIATDLMMYTSGDGSPTRFLKVPTDVLEPFVEKLTDTAAASCAQVGIGLLHESMSESDKATINHLFQMNAIQVLAATAGMCRSISTPASLVVVMGTQYFDSSGLGGEDFPVPELLQMLGLASPPQKGDAGVAVLMCHSAKKEYYKKFLFEPLPVESHLDMCLHDYMVAEIFTGTVSTKQEAVDWLTYTFFYRRLPQNPNYYNMMGRSHRHIRDHLSELVEDVCKELHDAQAILVDETGFHLSIENLGIITAYHNISFKTAHRCNEALSAKVKTKSLLTVLCHATEFESLPIRPGEEHIILRLLKHAKYEVPSLAVDVQTKANALLQAHIGRTPLRGDLLCDQRNVVITSVRLLQAIVDVLSSKSAKSACLLAMELCQMVVQSQHRNDSWLLQLPGMTKPLAEKCEAAGVEDIGALQEMEDVDRRTLLGMPDSGYDAIARFCNRYPNDVQVVYTVVNGKDCTEGEDDDVRLFECDGDASLIELQVKVSRDEAVGVVDAPRFPGVKEEFWWVVCGDGENNVLGIKRFSFDLKHRCSIKIDNFKPGKNAFTLFVMCDSYLGCDQEYQMEVTVNAQVDGSVMEEG